MTFQRQISSTSIFLFFLICNIEAQNNSRKQNLDFMSRWLFSKLKTYIGKNIHKYYIFEVIKYLNIISED